MESSGYYAWVEEERGEFNVSTAVFQKMPSSLEKEEIAVGAAALCEKARRWEAAQLSVGSMLAQYLVNENSICT